MQPIAWFAMEMIRLKYPLCQLVDEMTNVIALNYCFALYNSYKLVVESPMIELSTQSNYYYL